MDAGQYGEAVAVNRRAAEVFRAAGDGESLRLARSQLEKAERGLRATGR